MLITTSRDLVAWVSVTLTKTGLPSSAIAVTWSPTLICSIGILPPGVLIIVPRAKQLPPLLCTAAPLAKNVFGLSVCRLYTRAVAATVSMLSIGWGQRPLPSYA